MASFVKVMGKILCLFGKHCYDIENLNSPGFRRWHYEIYVHKCKFCCKEKIESDSPYNREKLMELIVLRRWFLQELEERKVIIEITDFKYGEMRHHMELQDKFKYKYKLDGIE